MNLEQMLNNQDRQSANAVKSSGTSSSRPAQPQMTNSVSRTSGSGTSFTTSPRVDSSSNSAPLMQPPAYTSYPYTARSAEPNRQPAPQRSSTARDPRPVWPEEHAYFVWYCRTDLGQPWDQVLKSFEKQFGRKRAKGGLQCKFYRLLELWKVPNVREQNRAGRQQGGGSEAGESVTFGLVQRTHLRYPWMKAEHLDMQPLAEFKFDTPVPSSLAGSPCKGCVFCQGKQEA